jgi:hypothetical protein
MRKAMKLLAILAAMSTVMTLATQSRASGLLFREDQDFKGLISAASYY